MAARLKACVGKGQLLARSGGNEFAILLPQLASQAEALRLAERLQLKVRTPFKIQGQHIRLRCSIGIALSSNLHRQPDGLIRDAKIARYRARLQGAGVFCSVRPTSGHGVTPREVDVSSMQPTRSAQ